MVKEHKDPHISDLLYALSSPSKRHVGQKLWNCHRAAAAAWWAGQWKSVWLLSNGLNYEYICPGQSTLFM